jgi:anti-sigma factor RsiW
MTAYEAHLDVASYALGVLDPGDVDRFEEHLVTCDPCAMELESLLPVTQLLSYVDKGAFAKPAAPTVDEGVMFDRMANVVAFERKRARFRTVFTGAVAAAVAVIATLALSVGVFGQGFGGGTDPVAGPATSSPARASAPSNPGGNGSPTTPNGTTYSATDPRSGAKLTVIAESKAWGSQLGITLTKVKGPTTCSLLVVGRDGRSEVAGTWWVLPEGYGTTQHPEPLTLTSSTSMQAGAIDRLEIRAVGSDGANPSTLVSVKL